MKVVDISNQIFLNHGSPSGTTVATIAFWVRSQIGRINNLLFEDFYIDESGGTYEILNADGSEISANAVAIIEQLYKIYDHELSIRSNMNILATDSVIKVEDDGSSITRTNRNEVSKTFVSLKKMEEDVLKDLVTAYRMNQVNIQAIHGDDTQVGLYNAGVDTIYLRE